MGSTVFPAASAGFDPTKITLQQTFNTSSNNVTFPTGVNQVYALVIGAGGSGGASGQSTTMGAGGGGGAIVWGATPTASKVVVGAGGASQLQQICRWLRAAHQHPSFAFSDNEGRWFAVLPQ